MRNFYLSLGTMLWVLFWNSILLGQITVPDTVAPYQPIVAGCNCIIPQNGKATFLWSWDQASHGITSDDTAKLYIWAPPGSHHVDVVVLIQTFRDVQILEMDPNFPGDITKAKVKTIKVIDTFDFNKYSKDYVVGNSPVPPPGPGPGPGPLPPPDTDFAANAQLWMKAIPSASYTKEKALKIADAYSSTAAQAVATSGWDLAAFSNQMKQKTSTILTPDEIAAWRDPFFVPLAKYQKQLFDDRKLTVSDTQGIAKIWTETAEAIKKGAF